MSKINKNKIIFSLVTVFIILASFLFELFYFADYREERRAYDYIEKFTKTTNHKLKKMVSAMTSIGEDFKFILETGNLDTIAIQELLISLVKYNRDVHGSIIAYDRFEFDKQTEFFAPYYHKDRLGNIEHFDLHENGEEYIFKHYFHIPKILKQSVWLEPEMDYANTGSILSRFCVPFSRQDEYDVNRIRGVLVIELDLDWLHKKILEDIPSKHSQIVLLSQMGNFISHPNGEFVIHESIFTLAKKYEMPKLRVLGKRIIHGETDILTGFIDESGMQFYLSFTPVPDSNWYLLVAIPIDEMEILTN